MIDRTEILKLCNEIEARATGCHPDRADVHFIAAPKLAAAVRELIAELAQVSEARQAQRCSMDLVRS